MQQLHPKLVLGIMGNATSMALFLSPAPTFLKIFKAKSTKEYSGLPYMCALFNSMLWVLYGMPFVKPHSMLIISINVFGVAMELFFISMYLAFAAKQRKIQMMKYLTGVTTLYSAILVIILVALHSLSSRQQVVGSLGVVLSTTMYAAPLSVMGLVIRTKSVEYMPFTLSFCNFINSAVWSAYSLVTRDIFVAIPNGIGCLCGILQLVIYAFYYCKNTTPSKVENDKENMEGGKGDLYVSMHIVDNDKEKMEGGKGKLCVNAKELKYGGQ